MSPDDWLTIFYGIIIGFSLGLTGGGGSIFAVPLLIYGLHSGVREAVGISLAAVGATALFGAVMRWRSGELEMPTGLLFAFAGMAGAPLGTWIGNRLPDSLTLSVFSLLMIIVGLRMWRKKPTDAQVSASCIRDRETNQLRWTSRCAWVLAAAGLAVGILSGIFGVGGGFVIVPALVLVAGMEIHRAVATSLMVIALICVSGVTSYVLSGDGMPLQLTALFVVGGLVGMIGGSRLATRVTGASLNRVFAISMWVVALFVLAKQVLPPAAG